MPYPNLLRRLTLSILLSFAVTVNVAAEDKLLPFEKHRLEPTPGENKVHHPCLAPTTGGLIQSLVERDKAWSLPKAALAADFLDTINILVLRYDFVYEEVDDPNTTGRGRMDLSRPLDTLTDEQYIERVGHIVDPPPHDSLYFDAQLRALKTYWEFASHGKLTLTWDIYPPRIDSVYQLPNPMSHYGKCEMDSVIVGLERYFEDCIVTADQTSPEIEFSRYESVFLFHAGSDRQSDIGNPPTCNDLFTGYIVFRSSVPVDGDSAGISTALMMPETVVQDNRATALNAVMAHEFGHQLGLVDLYSTRNFMSMLGDFALMDNNGFGTGIDFGWPAGNVFGAIPIYPSAWSRAYLGFVDVVDYRQGTDIRLVAAEMVSDGIQVARVPISEYEYYLLENRIFDIDGEAPSALADSVTSVILGPSNSARQLNGEYDFLLPGSGVLMYHVDERVAGLDYNYDGESNFQDNQLQWAYDIYGNPVDQFITLVEADGYVNFGGYYRAGYGTEDDMFRDDRNNSFTPNTNPAAIDNSGNNTHIYITDIRRDADSTGDKVVLMDSVILFNVETDMMAPGFPVRAGRPTYGISPVADDLDGDGNDEILVVAGERLLCVTTDGQNFLRQYTDCQTCRIFEDTALASINDGIAYPIPIFFGDQGTITAAPVTGNFVGDSYSTKLIAVCVEAGSNGLVYILEPADDAHDGWADAVTQPLHTVGVPVAMSFGQTMYILTDSGYVYVKDTLPVSPQVALQLNEQQYYGLCRLGEGVIIAGGDGESTRLYYLNDGDTASFALEGYFVYGPILVDVNRDDVPEVVVCTPDGDIALVSVDSSASDSPFSLLTGKATGYAFTVNPIAGDVDLDGYPDIIIGGTNAVYAFNYELTLKTSFPIEVNDRYADDAVSSAPIAADIQNGGVPEIVFPTGVGNVYSFGLTASYGFPLSAGELGVGSPVFVNDTVGGKLGYLGADGWFYLWRVSDDTTSNFWSMNGVNAAGTFAFESAKLSAPKQYASEFPEEKFYNYPNPVVNGTTTIRYFLPDAASRVDLRIFDLSGVEVAVLTGPTTGGVDNELIWNCGDITPGVYRCVINVESGGKTETAFTDIAIIR